MAIPSPASEIILIEYFTKLGIPTFHLLDPNHLVTNYQADITIFLDKDAFYNNTKYIVKKLMNMT